MKQITFDYTDDFACLAGSCPDTCCKDWEIILDGDSIRRYLAMPGALGEQVRAAMMKNAEGETMWHLTDGHCALLRTDGLCPIQCAYDGGALCRTCRTHPRFIEEYGAVQELTLALSCPAAARLLLTHEAPLRRVEAQTDEPVTPNDLDPDLYLALRCAREAAFTIAQDRCLPLHDRMGLLLLLAQRIQRALDRKHDTSIDGIITAFTDKAHLRRQLARLHRLQKPEGKLYPGWAVLQNMEHLTQAFPAMLGRAVREEPRNDLDVHWPAQAENLLVYFLFRYFLKAVNDRQLLPRVESCVFHILALRCLCGLDEVSEPAALQPAVSLYCKEVEHSEDNLLLLRRAFARQTLPLRWLFTVLCP